MLLLIAASIAAALIFSTQTVTADCHTKGASCGSGGCTGTETFDYDPPEFGGGCYTYCDSSGNDCGTCCYCSSSGSETYDGTQDGDCSATTCAADACGAGGCGTNIWGDNPASVANECSALKSCTSKSCSATCEGDGDSDGYSVKCNDCNDADAGINPGASDANCDGIDQDCDGTKDDNYASVACGSGGCSGGTTSCSLGTVVCSTNNKDCGTCCSCDISGSETYDSTQDGDCSATTCTNGCGAGGCSGTKWGIFTDSSVGNECSALKSCTSRSCTGGGSADGDLLNEVVTCDSDPDGDGYGGGGSGSACYDCKPNDANIKGQAGFGEGTCNAVDNDCDSIMDEDYSSTSGTGYTGYTSCGIGGCSGGTTKCSTEDVNCGSDGCSTGCGQITCSTGNSDCGVCCICTNPATDPKNCVADPVTNYDDTQDNQPYTVPNDNADCPDTTCPADACGPVGGCETTQLADYPATVPNTCEGEGACTSNTCTATCQSGSDADKIHASCGDCNDADSNVFPKSCHVDAIAWGDPAVTPLAGEPCPAVVAATPPGTSPGPDPPNNNKNNCVCDESTTGGCNSGTCVRDTDGVICDNEIRVCTAGQNPFCNVGAGGDIWADTNTDKNCDTLCSGADCNPSCIPPSCDTAFYEECERCDGETSTTPFAKDTVNDYEPCSAGDKACPYNPYTDFCSDADTLIEYYCFGVDHTFSTINCNTYDGQCEGTCGTGADSCKARDYSCGAGACGYTLIDIDTNAAWCSSCSAQGVEWLNGGEDNPFAEYDLGEPTVAVPDAQECCGDDSNEKVRFRDCALGACADDASDRVCCNVETDCVFKGVCYNDIDSVISAVQAEKSAFCSGKNTQAACTSGSAKQMCTWNGAAAPPCTAVATKAAVQASQLEHMATGGLGPYPAYNDIDNDGFYEVCDAASPGLWTEASGTITGYVRNLSTTNCQGTCTPADCSKGCPVANAQVKVLGINPPVTVKADANGLYTISGLLSGTQDLVASKTGYDASTRLGLFLADGSTENVDFVLTQSLGNCEDDCTTIGSNVCDVTCHGKGLCWFYSDDTKAICDGTFGIVEVVAGPFAGQYIDCCKGKPYSPVKTEDVKVDAENVVTIKKPVLYKGRFVNMVIVVFRG